MERFVLLSTGVRMEYVERGSAAGTPVIFLHGVTDSWRSFEPVLRRLPPSVRAFAVSQRGHGDSSRPVSGYTYSSMADDLRAFLDAMRLPKAVIVGHSMGAMVAQRFIVDHPDRVAAVVLVGAFSTIYQHSELTAFVESAILPLADPLQPAFVREWQMSTTAREIDPALLDTVVAETLKVPAHVWHATFSGFLNTPDFSEELARVSTPALLVWGDRDTYAVRADQDRLLRAIPGVRLLTYEGTGHALHWEQPERFTSDLVSFLEDRRIRESLPRDASRPQIEVVDAAAGRGADSIDVASNAR